MQDSVTSCIYCGSPAISREHIIATQIIDVLRCDPRGFREPTRLYVTLPSGESQTIHGRMSRGRPTLEYTTRVCEKCNNGWMNIIDADAMPYLTPMIEGREIVLDTAAQVGLALWAIKVVVTARSEPINPLPIEADWTRWLYEKRSPIPNWHVWVGHYVGTAPWWYCPHDIRVELGPGSLQPLPGQDFTRAHGVLATLVIGYSVFQVFGIGGSGQLLGPEEAVLPRIWPPSGSALAWPPSGHVDDAGLPLWAGRLLSRAPAG
jgi:hypothetical protein